MLPWLSGGPSLQLASRPPLRDCSPPPYEPLRRSS